MSEISRYRDSTIFYVKVDFGILAALAAIFTLLKLEGKEIAETLYQIRQSLQLDLGLIIYGLVVERLIVLYWDETVKFIKTVKAALFLQLFGNLILFGMLFGQSFDFIESYLQTQVQERTYNFAKGYVQRYFDEKGFLPRTLENVQQSFPNMFQRDDSVHKGYFRYEYIDSTNYSIWLAGRDDILNSPDDAQYRVVIQYKFVEVPAK